jgi:K+-sensing histidine kinase KdpD
MSDFPSSRPWNRVLQSQLWGYVAALVCITTITIVFTTVQTTVDATFTALVLLIVVLFVATVWGSLPALLASVLGVLSFDLVQRPFHEARGSNPDWFVLVAFLVTAVTAGQLSAYAKRRTREAVSGKKELEELYGQLRRSFERSTHAEAVRRSEQLKSSLLDAVTHNLRTPLTSIKAVATTLHNDLNELEKPEDLDIQYWRELLELTIEETNRLNRFVEGLVDLAQIEAGQLGLRRSWGTVDEIIANALVRAETIKRGHRFEVYVEDDLPHVNVDPSFMVEVIFSIVDNATKYAPPDTAITISATRVSEQMVQFAIEDQGRGIPLEIRDRVFDKFYRSPTTEANEEGRPTGIGMGLAIAKGIVEAHGGNIRIEDGSFGKGARVAFDVPINDAENPLRTHSADKAQDRIDSPIADHAEALTR